eukprot:GEMP01105921.1.p1 GENE.GEMP01105921.1~~GEMP01105921.1.p1  ORF type:complete len:166 (+),score=17.78 GEMP01105921.1:40-498(+)
MHDTPTLRKGGDDLRPSCTAYPQPRRSASRSSHEVPALSTMPPSTASPSTAELRADLIQHSEQFADRAKAVLESTRMASTIDVSRTSAHPSSSVERAHVLLEDARNETSRWKKYNDARYVFFLVTCVSKNGVAQRPKERHNIHILYIYNFHY